MKGTLEPQDWTARIRRLLGGAEVRAARGEFVRNVGTPDVEQRLCRYLDLLVTWNARLDLTAARDADELVDLFLADACVLAGAGKGPRDAGGHWVDVGSGAGAPGLPLALLRSDLHVTLVEPRGKRVAFLRTVVGTLGLPQVPVVRSRLEDLAPKAFDVAVSRATLPPETWAPAGAGLARQAVWLLLAGAEAPTLPGWDVDVDFHYVWPLTGADRRAVRMVPAAGK